MNYIDVLREITNITMCTSITLLIILLYKVLFLDYLDRHKVLNKIIDNLFALLIILDVFSMIFIVAFPNVISVVNSLFEKIFNL